MNRRDFLAKFAQALLATQAPITAKAVEVATPAQPVLEAITSRQEGALYQFIEDFGSKLAAVLKGKQWCADSTIIRSGVDYAMSPLSSAIYNLGGEMYNMPRWFMDEACIDLRPLAARDDIDEAINTAIEKYFVEIDWHGKIFREDNDVGFLNSILGVEEADCVAAFKKAIKLSLTNGKSYMHEIAETYSHSAKWAFIKSEYAKELEAYRTELSNKPKLEAEDTKAIIKHTCLSYNISLSARPGQPCVFRLMPTEKTPNGKVRELAELIARYYSAEGYIQIDGENFARIDAKPCSTFHAIMENTRHSIMDDTRQHHYLQDQDRRYYR